MMENKYLRTLLTVLTVIILAFSVITYYYGYVLEQGVAINFAIRNGISRELVVSNDMLAFLSNVFIGITSSLVVSFIVAGIVFLYFKRKNMRRAYFCLGIIADKYEKILLFKGNYKNDIEFVEEEFNKFHDLVMELGSNIDTPTCND